MTTFKLEDIPVKDLQALGLHDGSKLLLNRKNKEALLSGGLTSFIHLQNLKIEGAENTSLDAKLSLRKKADGSVGLFVHPIYREKMPHPNLSGEEDKAFSRGGTFARKEAAFGKITAFGDAPYQFDDANTSSFYIELEKRDGSKTHVWGIDLKRALQESGRQIGDEIQLFLKGREKVRVQVPVRDEQDSVVGSKWETADRLNWEVADFVEKNKREKTVIYEFDRDTNSFVSIDADQVNVPEEVNGQPLSPQQKKRYREGEEIEVDNGLKIQPSPASEAAVRANRSMFIVSLLVDGGLSYVLYKGVEALIRAGKKQKQEENIYSKGYLDALHKVQRDLEQKQAKYPEDREIARDLNFLQEEIRQASAGAGRNDNSIKLKPNDPEADDREMPTVKAETDEANRPSGHPHGGDLTSVPDLQQENTSKTLRR